MGQSLLLALTTIVSLSSFLLLCNLSSLPATCFMEHMDPDVDIIFIELAINDQRNEAQAEAYEWLLRALLALPTKPAVIHVQTFGLIFQMLTTGGDLHTGYRAVLRQSHYIHSECPPAPHPGAERPD
jgi:hypothetical protein